MSIDSGAVFWLYISVSEVLTTSIFRAAVGSIRKWMVKMRLGGRSDHVDWPIRAI
jgi:hypothetical protein